MMFRGMLGGCLMAIGILIAGVTGLCTLMFVRVDSAASLLRAFGSAGLPFFFGIALIIAGIVVVSSGRRDRY